LDRYARGLHKLENYTFWLQLKGRNSLMCAKRSTGSVGIRPQINHIKFDKHTRRLLFIVKRAYCTLNFSLFFFLSFCCYKASQAATKRSTP
jgi:hypothetical protein